MSRVPFIHVLPSQTELFCSNNAQAGRNFQVGPRISDEIFNERQSRLPTMFVYNLELSFQEVNEYLRKHDRGWNFGNFIFDVIFMTEPWQDILLLIIYPHLKHFYSDNRWHGDI